LHSLALVDSTKKVWAWGDNNISDAGLEDWDNRGALGIGTIIDKTIPTLTQFTSDATYWPVDVKAGSNYSLVLLNDGRLQASGVNNFGQLGTNELLNLVTATSTPVFVEDPADTITGSSTYFYAYRPTLSGQPATSTTSKSATITVCKDYSGKPTDYCKGITHYRYSLDGTFWSDPPTPIATPFTLSNLPPGTVNLWVKGMTSTSTAIQTDKSAAQVSWEVIATPTP
jgi:hypothetical protein